MNATAVKQEQPTPAPKPDLKPVPMPESVPALVQLEAPFIQGVTLPGTGGQRSLVRKLAQVMGEVERVAKNGRNDFHKYDYATESDITSAVRKGLAERSLILMPSVEKTEWRDLPARNGRAERVCTLTVLWTMEDGESGEFRAFRNHGEGQDGGDKATYKAMTGALKYALLKLFMIPTGDDPEGNTKEPEQQHQQQPPPQNGQRRAPAQTAAKAATPTPQPVVEPTVPSQAEEFKVRSRRVFEYQRNVRNVKSTEEFLAWVETIIGEKKMSAQWTPADLEKLESACEDVPF